MIAFLLRVLSLSLFFESSSALAHRSSDSFIHVFRQASEINGTIEISLRDLEWEFGLDDDHSHKITWGEVLAKTPQIHSVVSNGLVFRNLSKLCDLSFKTLLISDHSDGKYAFLPFEVHCPMPLNHDHFQITYSLMFDRDRGHRGLIVIHHGSIQESDIFSPTRRSLEIAVQETGPGKDRRFLHFFSDGIWHIFSGVDHLCLVILLITSAFFKKNRAVDIAARELSAPSLGLLKIITTFSVAHSLTLALVSLSIWRPPSNQLTEGFIAFTVLLMALDNLWEFLPAKSLRFVFIVGLIHGTGFGASLADLGLTNWHLVRSLIAFNLGIEFAQVILLLVLVPACYAVRAYWWSRSILFTSVSALCAIAAFYWVYQIIFRF